MSIGRKITAALEWTRLSLGGAMFGALGSNTLGLSTDLGPSTKRDVIWAAVGFAIAMWMLVCDARKTARNKAAGSVELDPAAALVEKH